MTLSARDDRVMQKLPAVGGERILSPGKLRLCSSRHSRAVFVPLSRCTLSLSAMSRRPAHGRWSAATAFDEALLWLFPGEAAPSHVPPRFVASRCVFSF